MTTLDCDLAGRCGGCPWIEQPVAVQRARRLESLVAFWKKAGLPGEPEVVFHSVGLGGFRDRVDLSLRRVDGEVRLGMGARDGSGLVDLPGCPLLTAPLAAWLVDFRSDLPPVDRAGVRLRVGPGGERGVWLDLSNADIKALLDERAWLTRLAGRAMVEIGQKRKRLVVTPERLKLAKSVLAPTFASWQGERRIPLYGAIGGFSQPGMSANRVLVEQVMARAADIGAQRWLELCAGSGNFSLPLALTGADVVAWEVDRLSLAGLARAADEQGVTVQTAPLNIHRASPRLAQALAAAAPGAILADPPRSGLGGFIDVLGGTTLRPAILYVSCSAESFVGDIGRLIALGYRVEAVLGIDQFPHTPHGEWVGVLRQG